MKDLIVNKLKKLDFRILEGYALFATKNSGQLIVSSSIEVEKIERKHKRLINDVDKEEVIKCQIIKDNQITSETIELPLSELYFTVRFKDFDDSYYFKLIDKE